MISKEMTAGMLFQELTRARHNAVHMQLRERGLHDLGAPLILFVLKRSGQRGKLVVQRELADTLNVSPATIAVSLKSLERGGYVEKRPDAADARCKRIALTPKGAYALEMCMEVFRVVDERMFRELTEEETAQLTSYLRRMVNNLRGEEPPELSDERMKPIC